jgi:hypothetical protein
MKKPRNLSTEKRPNQLKVMLSDAERAKLYKLAKIEGLSVSDIMRRLLRAAEIPG